MEFISAQKASEKMNFFGKQKQPFLFVVSYDTTTCLVTPLPLAETDIQFQINSSATRKEQNPLLNDFLFNPSEPPKNEYKKAFLKTRTFLKEGTLSLVNLTQSCPVETNHSLHELYQLAQARYKLYIRDKFVVFSPETFIKIEQSRISTFPMKGTIDATLPNAKNRLLNDPKERTEHELAIQLIKEDLATCATNVRVDRFRYFDLISTHRHAIWETSSEVSGQLPKDYESHLGDILFRLLPGGSITGYPKKYALQVIDQVEGHKRGFYTGVFGVYDGKRIDSAVMIRFVEKTENGLIYKSGGGITIDSQLESEYQEFLKKIYVPIA